MKLTMLDTPMFVFCCSRCIYTCSAVRCRRRVAVVATQRVQQQVHARAVLFLSLIPSRRVTSASDDEACIQEYFDRCTGTCFFSPPLRLYASKTTCKSVVRGCLPDGQMMVLFFWSVFALLPLALWQLELSWSWSWR